LKWIFSSPFPIFEIKSSIKLIILSDAADAACTAGVVLRFGTIVGVGVGAGVGADDVGTGVGVGDVDDGTVDDEETVMELTARCKSSIFSCKMGSTSFMLFSLAQKYSTLPLNLSLTSWVVTRGAKLVKIWSCKHVMYEKKICLKICLICAVEKYL